MDQQENRKKKTALASPLEMTTPGQALQEDHKDEQGGVLVDVRSGSPSSASSSSVSGSNIPFATLLGNQLLQQQENSVNDTVRHRNGHPPLPRISTGSNSSSELMGLFYSSEGNLTNTNSSGNLQNLFRAPEAPAERLAATTETETDTVEEGQQTGVIDFRAALLAEQRQQDAILQEQQRRFEERQNNNTSSYSPARENRSDFPASSLRSSKSSSSPATSIIQRPPIHPSNLPPRSGSPQSPSVQPNSNMEISPLGDNQPAHRHSRTVSWSLDKLEHVIEVPEIIAESSSSSPPSLVPNRRRQRPSSGQFSLLGSNNRISLRDIVGGITPFESEAETNILRAVDELGLEQHQQRQYEQEMNGDASERSSFFSNLPEDFILPLPQQSNHSRGQQSLPNETPHTNHRHARGFSDVSFGNASVPPPRPSSQQRTKRPRPKAHRHTQSVEQMLFGLTAKLSKLDGDAQKNMHASELDQDLLDSDNNTDWKPSAPPKGGKARHRRGISSAQRFAEATQTLVTTAMMRGNNQHKDARPSSVRVPTTPPDIESPPESYQHDQPAVRNNNPMNASGRSSATPHSDPAKTNELSPSPGSIGSNPSVEQTSQPTSVTGRSKQSSTVLEELDEDAAKSNDDNDEPTTDEAEQKRTMKKHHSSLGMQQDLIAEAIREDWETFNEFWSPRKKSMRAYCKSVFFFVILPATGVAAIFHYILGNPQSLSYDEVTVAKELQVDPAKASVSWWILFMCVRQVITFSMALATQAFIIDFIVLGSRFSLQLLGPVFTLLVVQSKGWPFVTIVWALYDMLLLAGSSRFVNHWCYWQQAISLFNEANPSGNVPNSNVNLAILRLAVVLGIIVAIKRLVVGLLLGRQTFIHYGEEVAKVMSSMVLVGEVAALSRLPLPRRTSDDDAKLMDDEWKRNLEALITDEEVSSGRVSPLPNFELPTLDTHGNSSNAGTATAASADDTVPKSVRLSVSGGKSEYTESEKQLITDLVERWEEPELVNQETSTKVTLGALLQFRRALAHLKRHYPFSPAFGPCATRELCLESAQQVYDRLLLRNLDEPEEADLHFDVLAAVAIAEGEMDEDKLKDLVKLFRPDRDAKLSMLAFVKSVDAAYKQLRLLQANIHNSSQIDNAIENLINVGFYFLLGCFVLTVFGLDPMEIFYSLSSFVIAFAFMIGTAAAKYFEGVLLILVQRPFGVGDRIHVSQSESETSFDGSSGWIVEKINLFSTTVCFGTTNERATVSNGTLASSRIINAARSPNAIVYVNLKFGIDVPYQRIQVFQSAVETHVKARPREWLGFLGFRAGGISVDRGFIEYKVVVQHRDAWQDIISILNSKARLTSYCLELAKQLQMRYVSPPLPVDLNVFNARHLPPEALEIGTNNTRIESTDKTA